MAAMDHNITVDSELLETAGAICEVTNDGNINAYIQEAISYANNMRLKLPETVGQLQDRLEQRQRLVFRLKERSDWLRHEEQRKDK